MARILLIFGLAACVVLAAASLASAGDKAREPAVFSSAELGSFEIISGILVESKTVDQRGVWLDDTLACSKKRTLRVRATIFYTPASGPTKRVVRNRKAGSATAPRAARTLASRSSRSAMASRAPTGQGYPAPTPSSRGQPIAPQSSARSEASPGRRPEPVERRSRPCCASSLSDVSRLSRGRRRLIVC
jgi:hypothetical protein